MDEISLGPCNQRYGLLKLQNPGAYTSVNGGNAFHEVQTVLHPFTVINVHPYLVS
jgi:hypothetical protein